MEAVFNAAKSDHSCDVVLLDTSIRHEDLADVCQRTKNAFADSSVCLILLADPTSHDVAPCHSLEGLVDGYVSKPVDGISLCAWVSAAMRLRVLQAELAKRPIEARPDGSPVIEAFATLSHTVNNPLQALYATVDMLLLTYPDDEKIESMASNIFTHAERVARTVADASASAKLLLRL